MRPRSSAHASPWANQESMEVTMRRVSVAGLALLFLVVVVVVGFSSGVVAQDTGGYADLLNLFEEFRDFSQEEYRGDLSAYAAAMETKFGELRGFQRRLAELDIDSWPSPSKSTTTSFGRK